MIGINNRDLDEQRVDIQTTFELMPDVPAGKTVVAESGISGREELSELDRVGVDAVLIGGALMTRRRPGGEDARADRRRRDARTPATSPRARASLGNFSTRFSGASTVEGILSIWIRTGTNWHPQSWAIPEPKTEKQGFFRSSFGSALLGGAVVAVVGAVLLLTGAVKSSGGGTTTIEADDRRADRLQRR